MSGMVDRYKVRMWEGKGKVGEEIKNLGLGVVMITAIYYTLLIQDTTLASIA